MIYSDEFGVRSSEYFKISFRIAICFKCVSPNSELLTPNFLNERPFDIPVKEQIFDGPLCGVKFS